LGRSGGHDTIRPPHTQFGGLNRRPRECGFWPWACLPLGGLDWHRQKRGWGVGCPGEGQAVGPWRACEKGGSVKAGRPWRWSGARRIRHRQAPRTPLDAATQRVLAPHTPSSCRGSSLVRATHASPLTFGERLNSRLYSGRTPQAARRKKFEGVMAKMW
jgi:hypothetical protein